jgi:signal transduction histidine kinase
VPRESGNEVVVRFARLASEARTGAAILPLLADALARQVGADAVAVLEIQANGRAALIASPHCPKELEALTLEPDVIGEELGKELLAACTGRFEKVHSRPLVNGGGLFGFVVMFFGVAHQPEQLALAEALVDLAAIALGSAAQMQQLVKANAELRASQKALARTEKLRALGQMAAGVSHDLRNILNPLSLLFQVADRAIDRGQTSDAKESIGEMKQVLTRGVQTIERLRDYSRQSPESRAEEVDLNRLVHEASAIARPRMAARGGSMSRIREELGAPPAVLGRSGEIVSALVNLIVNAIDALRDGGTITLRTGESDDGSWVQVADDGSGMPPDVEARVFEPFFTTKGEDGTGLGLAMVYASMQRHGGSVRLETAPGKGAAFTLWFPRSASAKPPPASSR